MGGWVGGWLGGWVGGWVTLVEGEVVGGGPEETRRAVAVVQGDEWAGGGRRGLLGGWVGGWVGGLGRGEGGGSNEVL